MKRKEERVASFARATAAMSGTTTKKAPTAIAIDLSSTPAKKKSYSNNSTSNCNHYGGIPIAFGTPGFKMATSSLSCARAKAAMNGTTKRATIAIAMNHSTTPAKKKLHNSSNWNHYGGIPIAFGTPGFKMATSSSSLSSCARLKSKTKKNTLVSPLSAFCNRPNSCNKIPDTDDDDNYDDDTRSNNHDNDDDEDDDRTHFYYYEDDGSSARAAAASLPAVAEEKRVVKKISSASKVVTVAKLQQQQCQPPISQPNYLLRHMELRFELFTEKLVRRYEREREEETYRHVKYALFLFSLVLLYFVGLVIAKQQPHTVK